MKKLPLYNNTRSVSDINSEGTSGKGQEIQHFPQQQSKVMCF